MDLFKLNPVPKILSFLTRLNAHLTRSLTHWVISSNYQTFPASPSPTKLLSCLGQTITYFHDALVKVPALRTNQYFPHYARVLRDAHNLLINHVDASTSTEPTLEQPKPTYASVAAQADAPTLSPLAQPKGSGPSHSLSPTHATTAGSRPPGHGPKPPALKARKSVRFTGAQPKSPSPPLDHHLRQSKVGQQVRLVACVANRINAYTTDNPRFKAWPTDVFAELSKSFHSTAPGCVPLGYRINRKGNLILNFTPTTPRSLLMSNLRIIQGIFELDYSTPILFDSAWSTIHLANVPTRLHDSASTFDQVEILETLRNNPALAALPITLQPRWLRHPSKITGPRSSVVFSFEDPDGAIAQQLLKTPTFMFGQSVTVKPWINKPASIARSSAKTGCYPERLRTPKDGPPAASAARVRVPQTPYPVRATRRIPQALLDPGDILYSLTISDRYFGRNSSCWLDRLDGQARYSLSLVGIGFMDWTKLKPFLEATGLGLETSEHGGDKFAYSERLPVCTATGFAITFALYPNASRWRRGINIAIQPYDPFELVHFS
ncbi:hypothetical protein RSOL_334490, partial [Rhizoctonia solani AG-3 Rhs1AP]